jgi:hypothetical protein
METDTTNDSPCDDDKLSQVERYLLGLKGYTAREIEAIERAITTGFRIEDLPYLNTERASSKHKSDEEPGWTAGPEPETDEPGGEADHHSADGEEIAIGAFFNTEDALPGLEDVWRAGGVRGVIKEHRDFFVSVEDTYYTFRDWKQVRLAFFEAELTPLPGQAEIESACGRAGLDLPSVTIDFTRYFDFEFVGASDEAKTRRAREHAQARDEVLRYLVGKRIERWE